MDLSVVVPVYNKERCIESFCMNLISSLDEIKKSYEIILIDDYSKDSSAIIIERVVKNKNAFKFIKNTKNEGQRKALFTGLNTSSGNNVITLDADIKISSFDILRILDELEKGSDIISCYRTNINPRTWRVVVSKIVNYFFKILLKCKIKDMTSPIKACKRSVISLIKNEEDIDRILLSTKYLKWTEIKIDNDSFSNGYSSYNVNKLFKRGYLLFKTLILNKAKIYS